MIKLDGQTGLIAGYAATPIDHKGRNRSANRAEEQQRGGYGRDSARSESCKAQQAGVRLSQQEYQRPKQN
jgi:hypothetical protein